MKQSEYGPLCSSYTVSTQSRVRNLLGGVVMNKVLFKDQYTSGYAKKIAGSYTLVAGFLIR